jgi:hypothetical protein
MWVSGRRAIDHLLRTRPLWRLIDKYARTVDLCRDDAADTVGQVLGVPVLS